MRRLLIGFLIFFLFNVSLAGEKDLFDSKLLYYLSQNCDVYLVTQPDKHFYKGYNYYLTQVVEYFAAFFRNVKKEWLKKAVKVAFDVIEKVILKEGLSNYPFEKAVHLIFNLHTQLTVMQFDKKRVQDNILEIGKGTMGRFYEGFIKQVSSLYGFTIKKFYWKEIKIDEDLTAYRLVVRGSIFGIEGEKELPIWLGKISKNIYYSGYWELGRFKDIDKKVKQVLKEMINGKAWESRNKERESIIDYYLEKMGEKVMLVKKQSYEYAGKNKELWQIGYMKEQKNGLEIVTDYYGEGKIEELGELAKLRVKDSKYIEIRRNNEYVPELFVPFYYGGKFLNIGLRKFIESGLIWASKMQVKGIEYLSSLLKDGTMIYIFSVSDVGVYEKISTAIKLLSDEIKEWNGFTLYGIKLNYGYKYWISLDTKRKYLVLLFGDYKKIANIYETEKIRSKLYMYFKLDKDWYEYFNAEMFGLKLEQVLQIIGKRFLNKKAILFKNNVDFNDYLFTLDLIISK